MDVLRQVRDCLRTWNADGESTCRNILIAPHCNITNPECLDVITTAYHTLLCATLLTWSPPHPLTPRSFAEFVHSVLLNLPSSSSLEISQHAAIFGDHLVDMIWAVDTQLDELLNEARTATTASGEKGAQATLLEKAKVAQQNAENDKQRIPVIVMKLLSFRIISPDHCRERLESAVLASAGLIPDKGVLDKKEIRMRTGLFYKQNKFNLLREQSEGYSKITVELTSNLGPPHSPQTGRPIESCSVIEERARPVWEKVISLIGYFDLDPNRALDIILDVLSQHLASHYSFFIYLLSFSPWSGSYRRPPAEVEGMDTKSDFPSGSFKGKCLDDILTLTEKNSKLKPIKNGGCRVLAQVLGFKFSYYQGTDVSEHCPRNLHLTAALLIKEGFITLEDLYPHLSPNDEGMENHRKNYLSDVQSRIAGAKSSLLAMAAPLESGQSSSTKPSMVSVSEPKKPDWKRNNQKVGLLTGLLAVGAIKPAISIMSKFPWLVDAHPEIADLMIRIVKVSLSPLYDSLLITKERNQSFTHSRARYGPSGVIYPSPRKSVLTLWAPNPPSTNVTDFVFFYPDWADLVPISESLDDLEDVIEPLLRFVGLHISRDPLFLTKFLRLGRLHLLSTMPTDPVTKKPAGEPDAGNPVRQFWFTILRRYLLPALSLIRGNAVCTVEVWNIIRQYETTARWKLYGEWKSSIYQSHAELRIRAVQADRESKGILRRLSHNTIDSLSGSVAKLAHSNPCIFFSNAVNQIMAYDNLASVVIQALRYSTNMGFDVLVFIILAAISNADKERVKDDGVNTSDWLQSLASFTGMLFRRYSADLTPVLKYIVHQLHNGQTTEIIVLRELIWKMAGIEPLPSLSESQMAAMAGGPALRIEAIGSSTRGARLDPGDAILKGPQRLGKTLLESGLALPLLIQVAQQRQACVYKAPNTHLKSLAGLYDATHGVLLQYLELLNSPSVVAPQDYATKVLPPLAELSQNYGICAPICMQIIRPVLNAALLASALAMQEQERIANEEAEKRLKAALTAKREPNAAASRIASPAVGNPHLSETSDVKSYNEDVEATMDVDQVSSTVHSTSQKEESPWLSELAAYFEDMKVVSPGNAYDVIGPGFYTTFWQLSTYDLAPPSSRYDEELGKLRTLSRQEDSKYINADRAQDRSKRSSASSHRTRRERYNAFINTLGQEFKDQTASRMFTIKRIAREKQYWFAHSSKSGLLINSIIEHCIQPRCLLSPMDADFCAQIIKVLHTQGTPGFHTLGCYDKLLGDHVKVVLFSCSEYEARNYGRFLLGILRDIQNWHLDESLYIQDNRTKIGGKMATLPGFQKAFSNKVSSANVLKWTAFQQVVRKWHRKLAKCFIDCIQTGEFMHVYNAIVVMKEILEVFPLATVNEAGPGINAAVDRFIETEERGDLKILARSYSASLKKRELDWAPPKLQSHLNGIASPRPHSTSSPVPEKTRNPPPPNGPSAQSASNDTRRTATSTTPSAPRAQIANSSSAIPGDRSNANLSSTKLAMESIPRPEVVKRIRPDSKPTDSVKIISDRSDVNDRKVLPISGTSDESNGSNRHDNSESTPRVVAIESSVHPNGPKDIHRLADQTQLRLDSIPVMPPPSVPSQTASAQELRETARQTMARSERSEARSLNGSAAPSPRLRSPSPLSRPGTRNASNDSRASGGKSRSDPGTSDERRVERESRLENRETVATPARRDSLTHTRADRSARDRSGRESEKERESERDKERGRDRHSDRDREKDRDRDRDRERDRERERDRDRHRRDEKDRDRETRKERDAMPSRGVAAPAVTTDDRGLPSRPDVSRHRSTPQNDDAVGSKRRRATEDESERSSKRSSRKESHRDERTRRPEGRESERRRKDRDGTEVDTRASSSDKRQAEPVAGKSLPATTPSGPRAMGSGDSSRKTEVLMGRERHRDTPQLPTKELSSAFGVASSSNPQEGSRSSVSLRSRIGEKEAPLSFRGEASREDDREMQRKRTLADCELDIGDSNSGPVNDVIMQPPKRPRTSTTVVNNNSNGNIRRPFQQGGPHGVARKLLPIDHSDKNQRR